MLIIIKDKNTTKTTATTTKTENYSRRMFYFATNIMNKKLHCLSLNENQFIQDIAKIKNNLLMFNIFEEKV